MAKAIDIANFFINLFSHDDENDMTNMKINKLLYFAQGYSFSRLGRPIFEETVEAWNNGPVVSSVYGQFKKYGKEPIPAIEGTFDENIFSADEAELLLDVAREYGQYTASKLRNMTHESGSPWARCYDGQLHTPIPNDMIQEYFADKQLSRFDMPPIETVGHTENGRLILSKEDFDDWDY